MVSGIKSSRHRSGISECDESGSLFDEPLEESHERTVRDAARSYVESGESGSGEWDDPHDEFHSCVAEDVKARSRALRVEAFPSSPDGHIERHNRRAQRRGSTGSLTRTQWFKWRNAFGGACAYCGEKVPRSRKCELCLEHVVPISRGGDTSIFNVVPACWDCNAEKGTKLVDEWKGHDPGFIEAFIGRVTAAAARMS